MNPATLITPTGLRDYAKDRGWVQIKEAVKNRLYVMMNPLYTSRQLVFPMDATAPDYSDAVMLIVDKLSAIEGRSQSAIIKSLLEVGDDGIAFRVTTPRQEGQSLPLAFAGSVVAGAQQLLLASACTVLKPQPHHPRLSRTEAQQLLEAAKFRHTESGSFVLNISCPVQGLDIQASLLPDEDDAPFVRRTTLTLFRSVRDLVASIETDSLDELIARARNGRGVVVSSNLCEAITRLEDAALKNAIDISIAWAACIPRPTDEPRTSVVRIQHDYFARIEEVRRELRSNEGHLEDVFYGTVERLDGEMGQGGKRLGEVVLSILTPDGEQVRARVNLDAEQYEKADMAHMREGAFVKVVGKLHPGRQPRHLSDIKHFDLMS